MSEINMTTSYRRTGASPDYLSTIFETVLNDVSRYRDNCVNQENATLEANVFSYLTVVLHEI